MSSSKTIYFNASAVSAVVGLNKWSTGGTDMASAWKRLSPSTYKAALSKYVAGTLVPSAEDSLSSEEAHETTEPFFILQASAIHASHEDLPDRIEAVVQRAKDMELSPSKIKAVVSNIFKARGCAAENGILDAVQAELEQEFMQNSISWSSPIAAYMIAAASFAYMIPFTAPFSIMVMLIWMVFTQPKTPDFTPPKIVKRNSELRTLTLGPVTNYPNAIIKIGGRFDGVVSTTGEIVEVKARQRKVYRRVFDTDRTQVTIYMAMLRKEGAKTCRLIEAYGEERVTHIIEFDPVFYRSIRDKLLRCGKIIMDAASGNVKAQISILASAEADGES